jgi:hypothetical protein
MPVYLSTLNTRPMVAKIFPTSTDFSCINGSNGGKAIVADPPLLPEVIKGIAARLLTPRILT